MFSINIISVIFNAYFAYLLNTYLIAARKEFQILINGSEYQGAWPPLIYNLNLCVCTESAKSLESHSFELHCNALLPSTSRSSV